MSVRELMKRLFFTLVFAGALAINCTVGSAAQAAGSGSDRRVALVVGNANYPYQPLRNPVNDARAMSATLQSVGFEVTLVENATRANMQQAILDFGETLKDGGVGLFYYAGHGLQVRGNNYLVPIDENIRSEASVRFEAIVLDAVLEEMSQPRPNRTNIVILDACRNNPYASRYGGSGAGLALVDAPVDFLVGYATAPGAIAMDGDTDNGLYTSEIIKAMSLPDLKIEDMFKRVRAEVSRKTRHAQVPWEASSLLRDFSFNLPSPPSEPPVVVVQSEPPASTEPRGLRRESAEAELAFWDSIKSSQNAADYEAYLQTFPEGIFAPLARARAERHRQGDKSPRKPSGPDVEEIEAYFVALTKSSLREKPTARSNWVGTISAGERVLATGKVRGANWYRVESKNGETGYIFGDLIAKAQIARIPEERAAPHTSKTVSAGLPKPPISEKLKPSVPQPRQGTKTEDANVPKAKELQPAPKTSPSPQTQAAMPVAQEQQPPPKIPPNPQTQTAMVVPPAMTTAKPGFKIFQDCPLCPKMVELPASSFMMGQRGGDPSEQPVHPVTIRRPFALGIYEVTFGEWAACVRAGGCDRSPKLKAATDSDPVRGISWIEARQYVTWLRKKTKRSYRLPTEAEWEYAARANTSTSYWWGDRVGVGHANCKDCGGNWDSKLPAKSGSYTANPFGLYDLNGGVWEWVSDCWNKTYDGAPRDGSSWERPNCGQRVLRGGSWRNDAIYLKSSSRFYYDSNVPYSANGLRVALTLN